MAARAPTLSSLRLLRRGPRRRCGPDQSAEPLLAELRGMLAEADVLPTARMVTAFLHGFVAMELAGAFRLGGDPEAAFARGLDAVLPCRVAQPNPPPGMLPQLVKRSVV